MTYCHADLGAASGMHVALGAIFFGSLALP